MNSSPLPVFPRLSGLPQDAWPRPIFARHPFAANHSKCPERHHRLSCRISDYCSLSYPRSSIAVVSDHKAWLISTGFCLVNFLAARWFRLLTAGRPYRPSDRGGVVATMNPDDGNHPCYSACSIAAGILATDISDRATWLSNWSEFSSSASDFDNSATTALWRSCWARFFAVV